MTELPREDLTFLIETARRAGAAILEVYETEFEVRKKDDASPLTEADLASHRIIAERLQQRFPEIPVLSEENAGESPYEVRRRWRRFWLVDPLDGTKEFIQRNGQFTVNIALIEEGLPSAGVVFAPAIDALYYGERNRGAWREVQGGAPEPLPVATTGPPGTVIIVGSRSHPAPEMESYLEEQRRKHRNVQFLAVGSSLKLCMVAAGLADIYPRFGATMEWDTAAAHAVAAAAGRRVRLWERDEELRYNKRDLRNGWFVVC